MLVASYVGTRHGIAGAGNVLIRFRLSGLQEAIRMVPAEGSSKLRASHSELVFEPGDGVEHLMPDKSLERVDGTLWCFSSNGTERLPEWSPRRKGKIGGARFKRIAVENDPTKWALTRLKRSDPVKAATIAYSLQGLPYDFKLILKEVVWVFPQSETKKHCSEIVAYCLGVPEAERINPCLMQILADYL